MKRLFPLPLISALLATCFAAPAFAEIPMPESCEPRIAGVALATAPHGVSTRQCFAAPPS